ncbi:MAG: hypothetical protein BWY25_01472 [Chloroflexi bacterium ADurb.Bin222]|nr:MAG: hypothetical protein BWY25_01472 [Chloroflexi bacterium ADurb.Bin222]
MRVHSEIRWVLGRAAVDALPSTVICLLLAFVIGRWPEYAPMAGFALVVMGIVAIGRFSSHVWWLMRASDVLIREDPRTMLLTADRGWRTVSLHPTEPDRQALAITGLSFITAFSGVSLDAQHDTPVQVYLSEEHPDLILMRFGDRVFCSEVRQRIEPGQEQGAPARVLEVPDEIETAVDGDPKAPPFRRAEVNPHIVEDLRKLASEAGTGAIIIAAVAVIVAAVVGATSGGWALLVNWRFMLENPIGALKGMAPVLFTCVVAIYIIRHNAHVPWQIHRGISVVRKREPRPSLLAIEDVSDKDEKKGTTWRVKVTVIGDGTEVTGKLLTPITADIAAIITGSGGLLYRTGIPGDPLVIQTVNGVLVCTEESVTKATAPSEPVT